MRQDLMSSAEGQMPFQVNAQYNPFFMSASALPSPSASVVMSTNPTEGLNVNAGVSATYDYGSHETYVSPFTGVRYSTMALGGDLSVGANYSPGQPVSADLSWSRRF